MKFTKFRDNMFFFSVVIEWHIILINYRGLHETMSELCDKNRSSVCTQKMPSTEDQNNVKACDNYICLRMGFLCIFVLPYQFVLRCAKTNVFCSLCTTNCTCIFIKMICHILPRNTAGSNTEGGIRYSDVVDCCCVHG